MEPYYYTNMNKTQQGAYQAIKGGLLSLEPSFLMPRLDNRELADVFFKLRLDCPEIFYGVGFQYRSYQNSGNVEMIPEYLFEKGKIKEHQKALSARIAKLIRPAKDLSELEKELFVHDFICTNVIYDKLKKPYSHEIIGPLGHGVGVCEGIAKAVKILCNSLGIWCIIAISDSNSEKNIKYRHAWNVIRIEGKYYHLDVTFNNSLSHDGIIRYDYFNLPDKQFYRDHEPVMDEMPICADGTHSYYGLKKLTFAKIEDISKRAMQAMRKGNLLIFQWRGSYLTKEVLSELLEVLNIAAQQKGKHAKASLNWAQAVFSVSFTETDKTEAVIMENANEGEEISK